MAFAAIFSVSEKGFFTLNRMHTIKSRLIAALLLILMITMSAGYLHAGQFEERRVWLGLKLFPSFLAADMDITDKKGPDGALLLLLVYDNNPNLAADMVRRLNRIKTIRGAPIRVEAIDKKDFAAHGDAPAAGVFLVQRMGDDLDRFIEFGKSRGVIVFSPFEADVERGVACGIVISHRIFPYINKDTMIASGIQFKKFFLRVADIYEN